MQKKILFVITKSNFGGAQRYVYDLATSLPKKDFEVVVAFGEGGELEQRLKADGVRTIFIKSLQRDVSVGKDFAVFLELLKIYRQEKPDVVHLNSSKIGGIGALAGRICRVPKIIFTAHGWAFNEKRNFISRKIIAFLQWLTVLMSHTTIAVSQSMANQILNFPFVSPKKIKVVYNGVAEIDFETRATSRHPHITNRAAEKRDTMLNHSVWIGTISELHKNKGIDVALNAFAEIAKKYDQVIFVVIGEGEERARLTDQIQKLGLADRAFLVGFIPDAKRYLKAFDIFTLTSRTEALPYVVLEAGLAGLPVIASAVGGIPEIINSTDVSCLVTTGKQAEHAIKTAIEKLITKPEMQQQLGQNLQKRVRAEFSQQKMLTETFVLYK